MAGFRFGGRRENRFRQFRRFNQALWQFDAANSLALAIFLPARPGEVTAHDAFDRQRPGFLHDHRASGQLAFVRLEQRWQRVRRPGQTVVGHDGRQLIEPEMGNLRQHHPFERDAVGHDAIERGDAIRGDHEQVVAQVENVADLAAFDFIGPG